MNKFCTLCVQPRKKAQKLWAVVEAVTKHRETKYGDKFCIKLVGVDGEVWVQAQHLSAGVGANFLNKKALPKNDKFLINRGFVVKQQKYLRLQNDQADTGTSSVSPLSKKQEVDPLKTARKHSRWIVVTQFYVRAINKVLRCVPAKRTAAVTELLDTLKPPKFCLPSLAVEKFLDGSLQIWDSKENVLKPSADKTGGLYCSVCEKNFS